MADKTQTKERAFDYIAAERESTGKSGASGGFTGTNPDKVYSVIFYTDCGATANGVQDSALSYEAKTKLDYFRSKLEAKGYTPCTDPKVKFSDPQTEIWEAPKDRHEACERKTLVRLAKEGKLYKYKEGFSNETNRMIDAYFLQLEKQKHRIYGATPHEKLKELEEYLWTKPIKDIYRK